jgi:RNA 2',3'-cyclic 3'-phosphodiesterase
MQEQLDLMGFEPERQPLHTLFFAITLDPHTGTQVAHLRDELIEKDELKGKKIGTKQLHVTLFDLELFVADKAAKARQAAQTVAMAPFEIVFDRALSFPSSQAFVLSSSQGSNTALAALQQDLDVAMKKQGLRAKAIKTPHLTLMYGGRTVAEHPVEPFHWTVKEFMLIRSHVGKTLHEPIGSWPLRG